MGNVRWDIGMASRVGWDLDFLQKKKEVGGNDPVKVAKKTTANGEKDSGLGSVEGTSKYGKLHYRVAYEKDPGRLQVTVLGCQDLKVMDLGGSSDPYVTVLLPNSSHSTIRQPCRCPEKTEPLMRTRTVKKCLNPVFNETFVFKVQSSERALIRQVVFEVFDWERVKKDEKIGKLSVSLPSLTKDWVEEHVEDLVFSL